MLIVLWEVMPVFFFVVVTFGVAVEKCTPNSSDV
jgi:hypothetical protein